MGSFGHHMSKVPMIMDQSVLAGSGT